VTSLREEAVEEVVPLEQARGLLQIYRRATIPAVASLSPLGPPLRGSRSANRSSALAAFVLLLLLPVGCVPFASQASPESDEAGAANPKPATYTDGQYHYRIDSPGPMSARSKGTASYIGPEERLEVVIVEGAAAADPAALADKDWSALRSSTKDFMVLAAPAGVTLGGPRIIKFMYSGTVDNPTTRKSIKVTTVRYYIAKNSALLAVVTYGDNSQEFDDKEADGFARSFSWL
jgi:hypothetical protein